MNVDSLGKELEDAWARVMTVEVDELQRTLSKVDLDCVIPMLCSEVDG